jgi:hypothetical protein
VKFSREEKYELRAVFPTRPDSACQDCGGYHLRACPRVKRKVFIGQGSGTGNLVEVEYFPSWDTSDTVWPEDVFDDEEEE